MTDNRAEIPAKFKWDLSVIYADEAAFQKDYDKAEEMIRAFPRHEKTMLTSASALADMYEDYFAIDRLISKLYSYAAMNFDEDTSVNSFQALAGKVLNLANDAGSASYFLSPTLLRMKRETVEEWMEREPRLAVFRRAIASVLRYQPHTLSDECEKLLADLQNGMGSASRIRGILANSDMRFGKSAEKTASRWN